jgi:hypothetical protein
MNFIRIENHIINLDNVAYVTHNDNRVVVTFSAPKSESSLHLAFRGADADQLWDYFTKSTTAILGQDSQHTMI